MAANFPARVPDAGVAEAAQQAFRGFMLMDLLGEVSLDLDILNGGLERIRPVTQKGVKRLQNSYDERGVLFTSNAIDIIPPDDFLENMDSLPRELCAHMDDYPRPVWTRKALEAAKVKAAGGGHRKASISSRKSKKLAESSKLRVQLEKLSKATASGRASEGELRKRLEDVLEELKTLGWWLVRVFSEGEWS